MGEYIDEQYALRLITSRDNIKVQVQKGEPLSPMKGYMKGEPINLGDELEEVQPSLHKDGINIE